MFPRRMMIYCEVVSLPIFWPPAGLIAKVANFISKRNLTGQMYNVQPFEGKNSLILDNWAGERFKKCCKNLYPYPSLSRFLTKAMVRMRAYLYAILGGPSIATGSWFRRRVRRFPDISIQYQADGSATTGTTNHHSVGSGLTTTNTCLLAQTASGTHVLTQILLSNSVLSNRSIPTK